MPTWLLPIEARWAASAYNAVAITSGYGINTLVLNVRVRWNRLARKNSGHSSCPDFFYLLAFLFLRLISGIANGNQNGRLLVVSNTKELLALLGIEVTDPAGGKALFSSSQTQMLYGNGKQDA